MEKNKAIFGVAVVGGAAVAGAILALIFSTFLDLGPVKTVETTAPAPETRAARGISYNPPRPQDAPESIKDAVMLGYNLIRHTRKYAAGYVGNQLNCDNCHLKGGITEGGKGGGLSLVGVAAIYPEYRKQEQYSVDLATRTNDCFERSMNGKPLPPDSKEMTAIVTYYQWISKGLPIYAKIPWLGLKPLQSTHVPDKAQGQKVFVQKCAVCHGPDGQGTAIAPPLWGPQSFNDGAGMAKPQNLSAFAYLNMPLGNPDLTEAPALDVGWYVISQPRPHFKKR